MTPERTLNFTTLVETISRAPRTPILKISKTPALGRLAGLLAALQDTVAGRRVVYGASGPPLNTGDFDLDSWLPIDTLIWHAHASR